MNKIKKKKNTHTREIQLESFSTETLLLLYTLCYFTREKNEKNFRCLRTAVCTVQCVCVQLYTNENSKYITFMEKKLIKSRQWNMQPNAMKRDPKVSSVTCVRLLCDFGAPHNTRAVAPLRTLFVEFAIFNFNF